MDLEQPTSIGKYEILSIIGRGGMGVVYRAQDPVMGRQVAIKTVTQTLSSDPGMLRRIYEEAEKMGMLRHDNIITVYDLGEQNGFPYIVMEYVKGDPLDRIIARDEPISLFEKLRIVEQICSALAYAHQHEVLHRDIKPANVIVRPDGVAVLLDFGIARQERPNSDLRLTEPGGVIGTVPYMAPERLKGAPDRVKGGPFDGRSDIFSTGILLFQLLTRRLPFTGKDYVLVNQLLHDKHPPLGEFLPQYPPALDSILDRSLAKEPTDRYQTADEMGADLDTVIEALREAHSRELLALATDLAEKEDFIGAQNTLFRLQKIDPKNPQARALARDLGQRISKRARATQAEQLEREADDAIRDRNFVQAIELLEQAGQLLPGETRIVNQLEAARAKKQTSDQIYGYLQQADQARRLGDFTGARLIVEKAIQLDTNNSRLRAAYQSLVKQAEAAALQARLKALVDSANEALTRKDFDRVLEIVRPAQAEHPDNTDLHDLAGAANEGLAREQRRRLLEDLDDRIAGAVTEEDAEAVAQTLRENLEITPTDPTLLRYMAQIKRTLHEHQVRRKVDETQAQCLAIMKSEPHKALDTVQKALQELSGNARLIDLEGRIQEHIGRLSTEEARAAILLQANTALDRQDFAAAVAVLEQCKAPVLTPEISQLLDFAREQSERDEQQKLIAQTYSQAQAMLQEEKFRECVALLAPLLPALNDPRLQAMLDQAQNELNKRSAELTAALAQLKPFADTGCFEQVIALVQSLPTRTAAAPEVEALRRASEESWREERSQLEILGRAYAALASNPPSLVPVTERATRSQPLLAMRKTFLAHRRSAVDAILTTQITHIQKAKAESLPIAPAAQLAESQKLLPFASDKVKTEWTATAGQYRSHNGKMDKLFGRLSKGKGKRKP